MPDFENIHPTRANGWIDGEGGVGGRMAFVAAAFDEDASPRQTDLATPLYKRRGHGAQAARVLRASPGSTPNCLRNAVLKWLMLLYPSINAVSVTL